MNQQTLYLFIIFNHNYLEGIISNSRYLSNEMEIFYD